MPGLGRAAVPERRDHLADDCQCFHEIGHANDKAGMIANRIAANRSSTRELFL